MLQAVKIGGKIQFLWFLSSIPPLTQSLMSRLVADQRCRLCLRVLFQNLVELPTYLFLVYVYSSLFRMFQVRLANLGITTDDIPIADEVQFEVNSRRIIIVRRHRLCRILSITSFDLHLKQEATLTRKVRTLKLVKILFNKLLGLVKEDSKDTRRRTKYRGTLADAIGGEVRNSPNGFQSRWGTKRLEIKAKNIQQGNCLIQILV